MTTEQQATGDVQPGTGDVKPASGTAGGPSPRSKRPWGWFAAVWVVAAVGIGGFFFMGAKREQEPQEKSKAAAEGSHHGDSNENAILVVKPILGGMERTTNQPGTIRAFEFADLFAKLSGYVRNLRVDRGDRVKKDDLLLEVYDPERKVAVQQAQAELDHAMAAEKQAEARLTVAVAAVKAAEAAVEQADAIFSEMTAKEEYREKQYNRIRDLYNRHSIEERLVDEQLDEWHSAQASVKSAQAGQKTALAQLLEAKANVEKANADLKAAQAQVEVNRAHLEYANVMVKYTEIRSPYDGVVTFRGEAVHNGAFIRAASEGGDNVPLVTVARNDKFRTIVLVPDTDTPYCKVGDDAMIYFDALPGRGFPGKVSRIAEAEDLNDRNMRVEIDLENKDGALRDGMWGRADILLEKIVKNLTIPSPSVGDRNGQGEGWVMVIKNGEIHRVNVLLGKDNGIRAEVISGLKADDLVVLRPDPSVLDGTKAVAKLSTKEEEEAAIKAKK